MVQGIEKRTCHRFEVSVGKVEYRKFKMFNFYKSTAIAYRLINLSKGGVSFFCEEVMRKNKKLIFKLLIHDYELLELLAKVRWQHSSSYDSYLTIGIVFMPFGTGVYMNPREILNVLRKLDVQYLKDR